MHSKNRTHVREGVKAADQLITLEAEEMQQLLYLAAVGEYKLGDYMSSRARLQVALKDSPDFAQAKNLLQAIEDKMTSDTLVAGGVLAAIAGVSLAVVAGLAAGGRR